MAMLENGKKYVSFVLIVIILILPFGVLSQPKKVEAFGWAVPIVEGVIRFVVAGVAGQAVLEGGGDINTANKAIKEGADFVRWLTATDKASLENHIKTANIIGDATNDAVVFLSNGLSNILSPIVNKFFYAPPATDATFLQWAKDRGMSVARTSKFVFNAQSVGLTIDLQMDNYAYQMMYVSNGQEYKASLGTVWIDVNNGVVDTMRVGLFSMSSRYITPANSYELKWDFDNPKNMTADNKALTAAYTIVNAGINIIPRDIVPSLPLPKTGDDYLIRVPAFPNLDDVKIYPKDAITGAPNKAVPDVIVQPNGNYKQRTTGEIFTPDKVIADIPLPVAKPNDTTKKPEVVIPANPAIPKSIDRPITKAEPITGNPPIPSTPGIPIDKPDVKWSTKLSVITTRFPFSLPFDFQYLLSKLVVPPKTPVINVNVRHFKFVINMDKLDPYMPFFRTFLIISFLLALVFNTRRLIGGAQ